MKTFSVPCIRFLVLFLASIIDIGNYNIGQGFLRLGQPSDYVAKPVIPSIYARERKSERSEREARWGRGWHLPSEASN